MVRRRRYGLAPDQAKRVRTFSHAVLILRVSLH